MEGEEGEGQWKHVRGGEQKEDFMTAKFWQTIHEKRGEEVMTAKFGRGTGGQGRACDGGRVVIGELYD